MLNKAGFREIIEEWKGTPPLRLIDSCVTRSLWDPKEKRLQKDEILDELKQVNELLFHESSPDFPSPLYSVQVHPRLLVKLVELGSFPYHVNQAGNTFLHEQAEFLSPLQYHKLVSALDQERRAELLESRNGDGMSPLHYALKFMSPLRATLDLVGGKSHLNSVDKRGDPMIITAVKHHRDDDCILALVKHGAELTATNVFKKTVLHVAAEYRNYPVLSSILREFPGRLLDPNCTDINNNTPLHLCLLGVLGCTSDNEIDVGGSKAKLERTALQTLHRFTTEEMREENPELFATTQNPFQQKLNIVRTLVEGGAVVNTPNLLGRTPLHHAICKPDGPNLLTLVRYLEEKGGELGAKDGKGYTALHIGPQFLTPEVYHSLVAFVVERGKIELFGQSDNAGDSVLHHAVRQFDVLPDTLRLLCRYGANAKTRNSKGCSALKVAIENGRGREVIEVLEESGAADIREEMEAGNSVLHEAVRVGNLEALEYFLGRGVEVNKPNHEGHTPLHHLHYLKDSGKVVKVARVLLEHGADGNASDGTGLTPLHYMASYSDCGEGLLELFSQHNVNFGAVDGNQCSVLHFALLGGKDVSLFRRLVHLGADPSYNKNSKPRLLHMAASRGNLEVVIMLLEEMGFDMNEKDDEGDTPLHCAIQSFVPSRDCGKDVAINKRAEVGRAQVVKYLVERGADVKSVNLQGDTPLCEADRMGKSDIIELLRNGGGAKLEEN